MKQNIDNIKLKFSCDQNWNDMNTISDGRFCSTCQKTVYDLTDKKTDYFLTLLAEDSNGFCGRFKSDQIAKAPVKQTIWKKWAIAAMVFIGFNSLWQDADAQTTKNKKSNIKPENTDCGRSTLMGEIAIMPLEPQTKANLNETQKFLTDKFYDAQILKGTLMTSFNVKKDGQIFNTTVSNEYSNGVKRSISKEVMLLLSKAPKWKNHKPNSGDTNRAYSLILTFKNGKITRSEIL